MKLGELIELYGDPGRTAEDKRWTKRSIVDCHSTGKPGNLGLPESMPGLMPKLWFRCHKLLEPKFRALFTDIAAAAPGAVDYAGGFNWRQMRFANELSRHSLGIAADLEAEDNGAIEFNAGVAPVPFGPRWKQLWPRGLPPRVIEAIKDHRFAWGGDAWPRLRDPMHVEYTLVPP